MMLILEALSLFTLFVKFDWDPLLHLFESYYEVAAWLLHDNLSCLPVYGDEEIVLRSLTLEVLFLYPMHILHLPNEG